ncbi:MAG: hypothetical protein H6626_15015 [Pseudobdellovibrionaceae bacterium]|nr:hypothetical protein [Bdellovibrionales bacterium]USN47463.1 MAG: hypothetical protein H6626_15015 [Pseudobdellovibrionaceae bacterium]
MNKLVLILFIAFGGPLSSSANAELLRCEEYNFPDLKVATLIANKDGYQFRFANTQDVVFLQPDPGTPISTADIEHYTQRAKVLGQLGSTFEVRIEGAENCHFEQRNGEIDWACYIKKPGRVGNLDYRSMAVFVYSQTVKSAFKESFRVYNLGWDINIDGHNYTVTVPFFEESVDYPGCFINSL